MVVTAATLDSLVKITQLIGIPVGIVLYGINKRRERIAREYATYDSLDVRTRQGRSAFVMVSTRLSRLQRTALEVHC